MEAAPGAMQTTAALPTASSGDVSGMLKRWEAVGAPQVLAGPSGYGGRVYLNGGTAQQRSARSAASEHTPSVADEVLHDTARASRYGQACPGVRIANSAVRGWAASSCGQSCGFALLGVACGSSRPRLRHRVQRGCGAAAAAPTPYSR